MKKALLPMLALLLALGLALPMALPVAAGPTSNLLVNPGAETGNMSGWTHSGSVGVVSSLDESCGKVYPNSGTYFFTMGLASQAWMEQTIDLTGHGGTPVTFEAGGWVQTEKYWGDPPEDYDRGALFIEFFDSGGSLGVLEVDPVENPCCEALDPPVAHTYAEFYISDDVPEGAETAVYRLEGYLRQSGYINVFFDDLFFLTSIYR